MYRILVTDDEEKIRALIRKYAQFEGHSVTEAGTGMEAVELCRRENFDIVIMDIMMPKMTGFELFEALKADESLKDIPFIILTAKGQDSYFEEGQEKGILHILTKPFSPRALLGTTKEILGE